MELEMDCLTSNCTKPKYAHLQGCHSSSYDVMAGQKGKAPSNVSDLNQNVETSYNSKLKST